MPLGLASFAYDFQSIRPLAERDHANIVSWKRTTRGQPLRRARRARQLLVDDMRAFFRELP